MGRREVNEQEERRHSLAPSLALDHPLLRVLPATLDAPAASGSGPHVSVRAIPVASSSPSDQLTVPSDPPCVFCGITTGKPGFTVLHEDDDTVVIRDRTPGSAIHLLAIPKTHIPNVKSLTRNDADLLIGLERVGKKVLDELGVSEVNQRMGFHIPPFYSVDHLHLHLLSTPLPTLKSRLKYRPSVPTPRRTPSDAAARVKIKGWSWFVSISQVRMILDGGGKVKVGSVWITPSLVDGSELAM